MVEVGGPGTLAKSLAAVRHGGRVALVGALSDPMATINPGLILMAHAHVHGIMVGSRKDTADLVQMIDANSIKPVIHRAYPFEQPAQPALAYHIRHCPESTEEKTNEDDQFDRPTDSDIADRAHLGRTALHVVWREAAVFLSPSRWE